MERAELDRMSTDDLWLLHVEVLSFVAAENQTAKAATGRAPEAAGSPSVTASAVPAGVPKIPQSRSAVRDLGRSWQAAALACRAVEIGKADRGFQYSEQEARSACGVQQKPSVISAPAFAGSPLRASLSGWSAVRWPMRLDRANLQPRQPPSHSRILDQFG
jgi:hypothetical protein